MHPSRADEALNQSLYHYKARVLRIVDGDTIDVEIDLGLGVKKKERVRLAGLDAHELNTKDAAERELGRAASEFVVSWVQANGDVFLKTIKGSDKYGRYLAEVFSSTGESLNQLLLESKMADPY